MDSLIAAAARALAAGDALAALDRVALRADPPALALRGIAMAQLGEYVRARELLRRAARDFGTDEELSRARCVVAEAEVALAMRDFRGSLRTLTAAANALDARGDRANALQARLITARRLLLLGRLDDAAGVLARIDATGTVHDSRTSRSAHSMDPGLRSDNGSHGMPPTFLAVAALTAAELAMRSLRIDDAQVALARAHDAAHRAGVPALVAEVAEARHALDRPAARRLSGGIDETLRLDQVAALIASGALILDACRRGLRAGAVWVPLARRPVLFTLARVLAESWPRDVGREALITRAFRIRRPDETHRARLRVEIGRLRALIRGLAAVEATEDGFVLQPRHGRSAVVLAPLIDSDQAALLALLSDGAAWSTSALALALGASQRTVQRALVGLETAGRVRSIGRARTRRWLAPPLTGFTTILLLPVALAA